MDLLQIGKFGVKNAQTLLSTTSNNINNVNTTGYTRKDTQTYTTTIEWGVGETYTRRIYDRYVQAQLYTDTGSMNYYNAYATGMRATDQMLSDDSMSIATSLDRYFDALSDSVQNPTAVSSREEVMSEMRIMVNRYNTLNESIMTEITDVNNKANDAVNDLNEYLQAVYKVNRQLRSLAMDEAQITANGNFSEIYLEMLDQRDLLVSQISEVCDTNVIRQSDGTLCVYMNNGQLLANGDTYAQLHTMQSPYDATRQDVYMRYITDNGSPNDNTVIKLSYDFIGGKLGGYLESTNELRQAMRDLGCLAAAFADAMNVQNRAGFTLEGKAGGDLFSFSSDQAYIIDGYAMRSDEAITCEFVSNNGEKYPANDFYLVYDTTADTFDVYELDSRGDRTLVMQGISADASGTLDLTAQYGLLFHTTTTTDTTVNVAKHEFYVQPTIHRAYDINCNINKPEDLAYASAVRVITGERQTGSNNVVSQNAGNAVISLNSVSLTDPDYVGSASERMGVYVDSGTHLPTFYPDAPVTVIYKEGGQSVTDASGNTVTLSDYAYVIYDAAGNALGYTDAQTKGVNVFAQASWFDAHASGYPGYDVTITGTVINNDSFRIEINTDGDADNSNGIALAKMRTTSEVSTQGEDLVGFTEAYANLTSKFGSAVSSATTDYEAAQTKQEQTKNLYLSESGVNLDEEAANLLMYQQTYQACAKIVEASQTVFQALISSF